MITVIEKDSTATLLGIRFWDPVLGLQISDGLYAIARQLHNREAVVHATRTRSGVYAFHALPGMREFERGFRREPGSPPEQKPFIIEVEDAFRRYNPVAFRVLLPLQYRGVYLSNSPGSPFQPSPKGVLLFSAPTRSASTCLGAVHGNLIDATTGAPAANALVRLRTPEGQEWYGAADENGRFLLLLQYPTINHTSAGSPTQISFKPLSEQEWTVTIEVLYDPTRWERLPFAKVPEYLSLLTQRKAGIFREDPDDSSPAEGIPELQVTLEYGKELIVRTNGLSTLMIRPPDSEF